MRNRFGKDDPLSEPFLVGSYQSPVEGKKDGSATSAVSEADVYLKKGTMEEDELSI
jgi:hypothetical protein